MIQNRNPVKQWMITFPKSRDLSRQEFVKLFPEYSYVSCCQEKHQDGSNHLHLIIVFKTAITKSKLLKIISESLPKNSKSIHVSPIRSLKHAGAYIQKEDTEIYQDGIPPRQKPKTDAQILRQAAIRFRTGYDLAAIKTLSEIFEKI